MVKIRLRRMGAKKAPFIVLLSLTPVSPAMAVSSRRSAPQSLRGSRRYQDRR